MPCPTHAAHHFVEDQEHAILVAYLADALEISLDRGHGAERGADDRLRDKGHHAVRAQAHDLRFQLVRDPPAVVMGALVRGPFGILVARRNVTDLDQHRFELGATPLIAAGSQSAKRVAVIALAACDQMTTLRFAALEMVLSGQLESRFDGFGAAGDEIDPVEIFRRMSDQQVSQLFGRIRGKEAGMGKGQSVDLILDRLFDLFVGMAKAGNGHPAGSVEISLAALVDQVTSLAANCGGVSGMAVAGEYVAHPTFLSSVNQRRTRSGIALVLRSVNGRQAVFETDPQDAVPGPPAW